MRCLPRFDSVLWVATATAMLVGIVWSGRAAAQTTAPTSEQVFKNIQSLKGIPVDDFMGTMGIMSAALGFDCVECHKGAGTDNVDWAFDTPRKRTARRMVEMVAAINRTNFGGRQLVTCWTCHRGRDRPGITPSMEVVYGEPPVELDDVVPAAQGGPTADQIIDKYIQALGGAEKLSALTSFVANGTSVGFGGFGGEGQVQIFAKAPNQRAMIIEFKEAGRDAAVRTFDGRSGWLKTPLSVTGEYEVSGSELDGANLDAQLSFPARIKEVLTNLRAGWPTSISDLPAPSSQVADQTADLIGEQREVNVVQGTGPRGTLATLYFDVESGLLVRMLRHGNSPIGRVPTQIDFGDYREAGGIKFSFRMTFAWLNGRDAIELNTVRTNVPIDAAVFGRPAPATRR